MIRPFTGVRARRTVFALWMAVASLLMSGLGAVPAAAAGSVTETGWIPLACDINGTTDAFGNVTGGIGTHIAAALKVTHDATLTPGQTFRLTGVSAFQVVPGPAQSIAFNQFTFNADAFGGVVQDFENTLTPYTLLRTALVTTSPTTSLAVLPLAGPVPSGSVLKLTSGTNTQTPVTTNAAAAAGATSLSVVSFTANFAYPVGTAVNSAAFAPQATSNFAPGSSNSGHQINQVAALQPTNTDAQPGGTGGSVTTLTVGLPTATPETSLSVAALPAAIAKSTTITLANGANSQTAVLSAAAAAAATTLNVLSFTTNAAYPATTTTVTAPDDRAYVSPPVGSPSTDPAPGQWWSDAAITASDARRQGVFSFGPIPVLGPPGQPNAFGPAPGVGGGVDPNPANDGTAKPPGGINVGTVPTGNNFTVTGPAGQAVILLPGDTSRTVTNGLNFSGPLAAVAVAFFHNSGLNAQVAGWSGAIPVACGIEAVPSLANANGNPNPCPATPPCYVNAFVIPIVQGTTVPEAPFAVMLPLAGLLVVGTVLVFRRRRATDSERP